MSREKLVPIMGDKKSEPSLLAQISPSPILRSKLNYQTVLEFLTDITFQFDKFVSSEQMMVNVRTMKECDKKLLMECSILHPPSIRDLLSDFVRLWRNTD